MEKLYVVVRSDLPAGDQLAQSCHAVAQFGVVSPARFATWAKADPIIVILAAPSRTALEIVRMELLDEGLEVAAFHEPDINDELTAIAFGGEGARFVSQLPLALREPRVKAA
jgi:hypothetical protein